MVKQPPTGLSDGSTSRIAQPRRPLKSLPFVGRQAELRKLDSVFNYVVKDFVSQVVLLTSCGEGVGKTWLIREWRQQSSLCCCTGIFHRSQYTYSAVDQALNELVTELVNSEDDGNDGSLESDLREAFEGNAPMLSILLETFPILCDLIPHGWSVREWIDHSCRKPLLKRALTEFIRVVMRHRSAPLVFVLEDIHEADADSRDLVLHIIKSLLLDNTPSLLFVVSFDYQASRFVLGEPRLENQVTRIHVENMLRPQLETIVHHLLGSHEKELAGAASRFPSLTKWIGSSEKLEDDHDDRRVSEVVEQMIALTSASALEIVQLASLLVESGLVERFGDNAPRDLGSIPDGVDVGSLSSASQIAKQRLLLLGENERTAVSVAACVGFEFRPEVVHDVMQGIPDFQPLVQAGFLTVVRRDEYVAYRFAHKSFHEAARALLDQESRRRIHWCIGESLKGNRDNIETDHTLLLVSIAEQLNLGRSATTAEVALDAARLSLEAGRRMSERGAFECATELLNHGIGWLMATGDDMWAHPVYDVALELHMRLVAILFTTGKYVECETISQAVLDHARQDSDTYQLRDLTLRRLLVCKDYVATVDLAIATLDLLGERLPRRPRKLHLAKEAYKVKRLLQKAKETETDTSSSSEADTSCLFDRRTKWVLPVLLQLGQAADGLSEPRLKHYAGLRALRICLTHGPCNEHMAMVMTNYAALLVEQGAFEWGDVVSALVEERHGQDVKATLALHTSVKHWTHPLQESVPPLKQAHWWSLELGEEEAAGSAFSCLVQIQFVVGTPLDGLLSSIDSAGAEPEGAADILRQVALFLSRGTVSQKLRDQLDYNFEKSTDAHDLLVFRWTKMFLAYIFSKDDLEQHANALWDISSNIDRSTHFFRVPHAFYSAMVALSLQDADGGTRYRRIADKYIKMIEQWEKKRVPQLKHKLMILLAERDRLLKRKKMMDIKRDFDDAIRAATEAGNVLDRAVACQRCAISCEDNDEETWSEFYRNKTVAAYQEWGATAMTRRLRRAPVAKPTKDIAAVPCAGSEMGLTVGITSESFRSGHGGLSRRGKHSLSARSPVQQTWSRAA